MEYKYKNKLYINIQSIDVSVCVCARTNTDESSDDNVQLVPDCKAWLEGRERKKR